MRVVRSHGYTEAHALAAQLSDPAFDGDYLERLLAREPATEAHFVRHFAQLIRFVVIARTGNSRLVEDVTQETFLRVFDLLRRQGGLEKPDRLGSFVYSVCRRVLAEHLRREQAVGRGAQPAGLAYRMLLDEGLVRREVKRAVETALERLSQLERKALRLVFLEEREREEVCTELGLSPDYLRVVLCRAKSRLRRVLENGQAVASRPGSERLRRAGDETFPDPEITDQ